MKATKLIRLLGINLKIKGYYYVVAAVEIACTLPAASLLVTKDIYPQVASLYHTTPEGVEHAIRTAVNAAWLNNRPLLNEIAGYPLIYRPSNKEFITMAASYLKEQQLS